MTQQGFRIEIAAGECLFQEGELGYEAYIIESGRIEIVLGSGAARRVVAELGEQQIFGEMALIGGNTRSASAWATRDCVLTVLSHDYLNEQMQDANPMLRHLLHLVMARGRELLLGAVATQPPSMDERHARELALEQVRVEQELRLGLERGEFLLHYQPVLRLADGVVAGFEALIRWQSPGRGRVSPDQFIPVAEACGLIVPLGHWIVERACADLRRLDQALPAGAPLPFMSVNLSGRQFGDAGLFPAIEGALEAQGLAPRRLRLEITESLLVDNLQGALALLDRCKALGVKLALDDFGTGYSSLSYLHRFPVDTLKLDRSFIRDMDGGEGAMAIVRAVARLAADLQMETVAEGVETQVQAQTLKTLGVGCAQGFLYSPGLPLEEAAAFLQASAPLVPASG